jgi:hypothetical protein
MQKSINELSEALGTKVISRSSTGSNLQIVERIEALNN